MHAMKRHLGREVHLSRFYKLLKFLEIMMQPLPIRNLSLVPCVLASSAWEAITLKAGAIRAYSATILPLRLLSVASILMAVFGLAFGLPVLAQTGGTAQLSYILSPIGVDLGNFTVDWSGNIYSIDNENVQKMTLMTDGLYSTQTFPITTPSFDPSQIIGVDGNSNIYFVIPSSSETSSIAKLTLSAGSYTASTIASGLPSGPIVVDTSGSLYFGQTGSGGRDGGQVVKLSAPGYTQSTVVMEIPYFRLPLGQLAVGENGKVYAVENQDGGEDIRVATPAGNGYTLSYAYGGGYIRQFAVDGNGNVFVSTYAPYDLLVEVSASGTDREVLPVPSNVRLLAGGHGNVYFYGDDALYALLLSGSGNFGTVNVGSASAAPVIAMFTYSGEVTGVFHTAVTEGTSGRDFTDTTGPPARECGSTIDGNLGYCGVDVSFAPTAVGTRYGAAELLDGSGNMLATAYVQGTGSAPLLSFLPGQESPVGSGLNFPEGVAVDANGNLYIADTANNRVLKETLSVEGYSPKTIGSGLAYPTGVAVDGAGNVYITDTGNHRVLKETLSAGKYSQSKIGGDFAYPTGVGVDGSGNVYVADTLASRVLEEKLSAGSYRESTVPVTGLSYPFGLAVDGSGNIYIADTGKDHILKETPSAGKYFQSKIGSRLAFPIGVAVDGSGNVYISDLGRHRLVRETMSANTYAQTTIISKLHRPTGVAVDGLGNVYISLSGDNRVRKQDFADPPSLSFAKTAVDETSRDSPKTVTLENIGNAELTFPVPGRGSNPSIPANFTLDGNGESDCPVVTSGFSPGTLGAGASCRLAISFRPRTVGTLSGSLTLTDDSLNTAASRYASQSISLSGTAVKKKR